MYMYIVFRYEHLCNTYFKFAVRCFLNRTLFTENVAKKSIFIQIKN